MKVLLVNGSPNGHGCTYTALKEIEKTLRAEGVETEMFYLGNKPIGGCLGCGACKKLGKCVSCCRRRSKQTASCLAHLCITPPPQGRPPARMIDYL